MPRSRFDFPERMEPGWLVRTGDPVPRGRTKTGDAGQMPVQIPESHGADQAGQVRAERAHRGRAVLARGEHRPPGRSPRRSAARSTACGSGAGGTGIRSHPSILSRHLWLRGRTPLIRCRTSRGRRGGTCPAGPWCAGRPRGRGAAGCPDVLAHCACRSSKIAGRPGQRVDAERGEPDQLAPAVAGVGGALGVAELLQPVDRSSRRPAWRCRAGGPARSRSPRAGRSPASRTRRPGVRPGGPARRVRRAGRR